MTGRLSRIHHRNICEKQHLHSFSVEVTSEAPAQITCRVMKTAPLKPFRCHFSQN
jgi:hypothetical protein